MPRNFVTCRKHYKLHDMSDSNGHFQKIMPISFNSHLNRQQIRSIYHIKTIFVWDSIDFKSYVSTCTSFQKISCCQLPSHGTCSTCAHHRRYQNFQSWTRARYSGYQLPHCDWLREVLSHYWQPITVSVGILVVCLSCNFINVHGEVHEYIHT